MGGFYFMCESETLVCNEADKLMGPDSELGLINLILGFDL